MKLTDIKMTYDLDFQIIDDVIAEQDNGETTTLCGFFTEKNDYWLPLLGSDLHKHYQARVSDNTLANVEHIVEDVANQLKDLELYDNLKFNVTDDNQYIVLSLQGYNDNNVLFNRKFRV